MCTPTIDLFRIVGNGVFVSIGGVVIGSLVVAASSVATICVIITKTYRTQKLRF